MAHWGREAVTRRLAHLRFPFEDRAMQVAWAKNGLREGWLDRTTQAELLSQGTLIAEIGRRSGMDLLRVYHHLGRQPDWQTTETNRWRLERWDPNVGEVVEVEAAAV